jgi:hypothetical protein
MTHHDSRIYDGQHYELVRQEPYTRRRDGTLTALAVWRSHCALCGEPFELRTPANSTRFTPNRRYQKHKRPGIRVNPRGRAFVQEEWPDIHDHIRQLTDAGVIPSEDDYAAGCLP